MALKKVLITPPPYRYNDTLSFKITVYNQGNVASSKVDIVDYIPTGYIFDSSINPGWTLHGTNAHLTYTQAILPKDSAEIFIHLKFIATDHPKIGSMRPNYPNPISNIFTLFILCNLTWIANQIQ